MHWVTSVSLLESAMDISNYHSIPNAPFSSHIPIVPLSSAWRYLHPWLQPMAWCLRSQMLLDL
jgi:hypothetical protein